MSRGNDDVYRRHLLDQQNQLQHRIESWYDSVQSIIPGVAMLRGWPEYNTSSVPPQHLRLLLPSITSSRAFVPNDILNREWRLREAQAYDALADLRGHLEVITYLRTRGLPHVDPKTREGLLNVAVGALQAELRIAACRYRSAYDALERLVWAFPLKASTDWRVTLKQLHDEDIQHITVRDVRGGAPSWIWNIGGAAFLKPKYILDIRRNKTLSQGRLFSLFCSHSSDVYCQHCRSPGARLALRCSEVHQSVSSSKQRRTALLPITPSKWHGGKIMRIGPSSTFLVTMMAQTPTRIGKRPSIGLCKSSTLSYGRPCGALGMGVTDFASMPSLPPTSRRSRQILQRSLAQLL